MNLHIIKYAKNHYGHSGSVLKDLAILIKRYSGWMPTEDHVEEIVECVHAVWEEYGERREDFPIKLLEHLRHFPMTDGMHVGHCMIEVMLSQLKFLKVKGEALADLLPKNYPDIYFGTDEDRLIAIQQLPSMF